ncbi:MAG: RluA family pseudouridine synthase [Fimbriimonadales bacterium]
MTLTADQAERLDRFVARLLPQHSRSKIAAWIAEGKVRVGGKPQKPSFRVEVGMAVTVEPLPETPPHDLTPADIAIPVLLETDDYLVIDKPRGLATHPAPSLREPSLVNALLGMRSNLSQTAGSFRPGIVHRLDKETTGLLVVAKNDHAHVALARQIERKTSTRGYLAVVSGLPPESRFSIDAPIARDPANRLRMAIRPEGKSARTHVAVVKRVDAGTLLAIRLETGRTHQIRVHLQAAGFPVLGDPVYAPKELRDVPLQLHAAFLAFADPVSDERREVVCPPPADFVATSSADEIREVFHRLYMAS